MITDYVRTMFFPADELGPMTEEEFERFREYVRWVNITEAKRQYPEIFEHRP